MQFTDFDTWNGKKKSIDARPRSPHCKKAEVWWCNIGRNIGSEQSCVQDSFARPVLVLKVFNQHTFWGLPITSSDSAKKAGIDQVYDVSGIPKLKGFIKLAQLRLFDNKRLIREITHLEPTVFEEVRNKVKVLI